MIVMCPSTAAALHFTSPRLSHLGGRAALDPVHIFVMSQHQHFRLKIQKDGNLMPWEEVYLILLEKLV